MSGSSWMLAGAIIVAAGCGGGASSSPPPAASSSTESSGGQTAATADGGAATGSAGPGTRSGLAVHIQNMRAGGNLVAEADPQIDRLDVSFDLQLNHSGTEPLTGLSITRARLVHDDGREIVFGVTSDGWDGRLDAGAQRVVTFHKTPDSASPKPSRRWCGLPMRIEITLQLAGRQSTAQSRHVQVSCPPAAP